MRDYVRKKMLVGYPKEDERGEGVIIDYYIFIY
jgi:hypothetical protein